MSALLPEDPLLIASYFTLAGDVNPFADCTVSPVSFAHRAEAAALAGYRGIGIGHQDIFHLLDTIGAAEIRRIVAANGLQALELEVIVDWFTDGERRIISDGIRGRLVQAAGELGAVHVKVAGDVNGGVWPIGQVVDAFGGLCDDAAAAGTGIVIELYPGSSIADLPTGCAIIEGAGRSNGGLLIDIWHMMRGGIALADVAALPSHVVKHVELDDADTLQVGTVHEDTIDRRRLCGEGEFPVTEFLHAIAATGYAGAYGVEMLSVEHRRLDVYAAARRTFDTTRRFFPQHAATPDIRRVS